jgi:hypothetical protein
MLVIFPGSAPASHKPASLKVEAPPDIALERGRDFRREVGVREGRRVECRSSSMGHSIPNGERSLDR